MGFGPALIDLGFVVRAVLPDFGAIRGEAASLIDCRQLSFANLLDGSGVLIRLGSCFAKRHESEHAQHCKEIQLHEKILGFVPVFASPRWRPARRG